MNPIMNKAIRAACAVCLSVLALDASAMERGALADGHTYVIGGIGQDEFGQLTAERNKYSVSVLTAAKGSGAYMSDVNLRISNASGQVVFEHKLAAPWLLVNLVPGKYTIDASFEGQTQTKTVQARASGQQQSLFYFVVPADVLPPADRASAPASSKP